MTPNEQVIVDMEVVDRDSEMIGQVKAVRETDFHVDRRLKRDVYVPFASVQSVEGNVVTLNVRAEAIDDLGWPHP